MSHLPERHDPFKFEDIVERGDVALSDIGGLRNSPAVQKQYTKELLRKAAAVMGQDIPGGMIDDAVEIALRMSDQGEMSADSNVVTHEGAAFDRTRLWYDHRLLTLVSPMGQGLFDIMERFPCQREQSIDIMYEVAEARPEEMLNELLQPAERKIDEVISEIEEKGAVLVRNKMLFHLEGEASLLELIGKEYETEMAFAVTENESFVIIEDYVDGRPSAHSVYRWQGGAAYWRNAPEAEIDQMRRIISRNRPFYNTVSIAMDPFSMQPKVSIKETSFDMEPEEGFENNAPRM